MKAITLLASVIVTFTSCNCQKKAAESNATATQVTSETEMKQEKEMPAIEYEATTRGFYLKFRVENQTLYIAKDRNAPTLMQATPISDADWKEIEALAKAVDLDKVKDFKWPTEKRFYDGAAHATVTFSIGRAKYPSQGFDHGYPPVEIEKLINKIVALAEKN
nr:hypothetical protein [uncultured Flavobacterium sp.]